MLLTSDLGFKIFDEFAGEFPGRFLNVGVAESNMIGVAAGLALGGMCPFAYSIAPFATLRCIEHVRNDVCYHKLAVTIVGLGGPGDPVEVEQAVIAAAAHGSPVYLRMGRAGDPVVHTGPVRFEIGRAITLRDGRDCTLISTGNMLPIAVEISDRLRADSIACRVLNMHTVKPLDEAALRACAGETRSLFTLEEHSRIGGLGSAIAEWTAMNRVSCPLYLFGADDAFASCTGSQAYLRALCGLTVEHVAESIAARLASVPSC